MAASLMWFGYITYPDALLTPAEQAALAASPFFGRRSFERRLPTCQWDPL